MALMQAIVQRSYGPPDAVLHHDQLERPVLRDDRVLLRVEAAALNPFDLHMVRGMPRVVRLTSGLRHPKQPVPGVDVAGRVEAVGADVADVRLGDLVFGFCPGAFAEYALARADRIAAAPERLSAAEAAGLPMAGTTALQAVRDQARVRAGQRVLVIGAAGGVGTFAVQLAAAAGAHVTGVCGTRNVELVRALGADDVIDHQQDDLFGAGRTFDVVLAFAGGHHLRPLRRLLAAHGTLVLSDGSGRFAGIPTFAAGVALNPFVRERIGTFVASERADDLRTLARMVDERALRVVLDRTVPLREVPGALAELEAGHSRGKVVVTVGPGRGDPTAR